MKLTHLLAATAVLALTGGVASAQQTAPSKDTPTESSAQAPTTTDTTATATTTTTSTTDATAGATTSAASATDAATGASVTTQMVSNGPIPDTPANRAKYGQPLSRAGKHTAAKGN